ncbi:hypothetical protein M5689_015586 [Euphorbia peplus]|nr:hypothetical protein M5689_015586 [Euphorbia peplus]
MIGTGLKIHKVHGHSFLEWLDHCWQIGSKQEFRVLCAFIWMIWFDHYRRIHGEKDLTNLEIVQGTRNATSIDSTPHHHCSEIAPLPITWIPPPLGSLKLNCDAAFNPNSGKYGAGFILRNEVGGIVFSGACPLGNCWSVLHAEILALLNGLFFARGMNFAKIVVSSDCKQAVDAILNNNDISYIDSLVHHIREIAACFIVCNFIHEKRSYNAAANDLAKWGLSLLSPQILMDSCPPFLSTCIATDFILS